jgi:hypothetical protein
VIIMSENLEKFYDYLAGKAGDLFEFAVEKGPGVIKAVGPPAIVLAAGAASGVMGQDPDTFSFPTRNAQVLDFGARKIEKFNIPKTDLERVARYLGVTGKIYSITISDYSADGAIDQTSTVKVTFDDFSTEDVDLNASRAEFLSNAMGKAFDRVKAGVRAAGGNPDAELFLLKYSELSADERKRLEGFFGDGDSVLLADPEGDGFEGDDFAVVYRGEEAIRYFDIEGADTFLNGAKGKMKQILSDEERKEKAKRKLEEVNRELRDEPDSDSDEKGGNDDSESGSKEKPYVLRKYHATRVLDRYGVSSPVISEIGVYIDKEKGVVERIVIKKSDTEVLVDDSDIDNEEAWVIKKSIREQEEEKERAEELNEELVAVKKKGHKRIVLDGDWGKKLIEMYNTDLGGGMEKGKTFVIYDRFPTRGDEGVSVNDYYEVLDAEGNQIMVGKFGTRNARYVDLMRKMKERGIEPDKVPDRDEPEPGERGKDKDKDKEKDKEKEKEKDKETRDPHAKNIFNEKCASLRFFGDFGRGWGGENTGDDPYSFTIKGTMDILRWLHVGADFSMDQDENLTFGLGPSISLGSDIKLGTYIAGYWHDFERDEGITHIEGSKRGFVVHPYLSFDFTKVQGRGVRGRLDYRELFSQRDFDTDTEGSVGPVTVDEHSRTKEIMRSRSVAAEMELDTEHFFMNVFGEAFFNDIYTRTDNIVTGRTTTDRTRDTDFRRPGSYSAGASAITSLFNDHFMLSGQLIVEERHPQERVLRMYPYLRAGLSIGDAVNIAVGAKYAPRSAEIGNDLYTFDFTLQIPFTKGWKAKGALRNEMKKRNNDHRVGRKIPHYLVDNLELRGYDPRSAFPGVPRFEIRGEWETDLAADEHAGSVQEYWDNIKDTFKNDLFRLGAFLAYGHNDTVFRIGVAMQANSVGDTKFFLPYVELAWKY